MNISVICHNPECCTKFAARRKSAKYCSTKCRDKMAKARRGVTKERGKCANCKYCGRSFYVSSKGRFPSFCSDSHRVMYYQNVKSAAAYAVRNGQAEFMTNYQTLQRAIDYIYDNPNAHIVELFTERGYRFDGRQFVKNDEQPKLF